MSIVPVYIPSSYNAFLYFWERQVHKDSKLGIMTNVDKSRLVKVIFTNIHKIVMHVQTVLVDTVLVGMRNVFTFY